MRIGRQHHVRVLLVAAAMAAAPLWTADAATGPELAPLSTADHSKFKELQGPFASGPEVTKACLECHTEAAEQIHNTLHWTWSKENPVTGQTLGKRNVINNFCGSIRTNEPRCTSCHVGYGWEDDSFDFTDETKVDCLVCHDTTGTYSKFPTDAGHPLYEDRVVGGKVVKAPDLAHVAQNVGPTSRANCGACHFNGGGGDGVKHGDLDSTLTNPPKELDVHMAADGLNFTCSTCHKGQNHGVAGSRYATRAVDTHGIDVPGHTDGDRATCESCHGDAPHHADKLNDHTDIVACQTCHIPAFARGGKPTKTWWDWSTAGKLDENGKPIKIKNEHGEFDYLSTKGDFRWEEDVQPEYRFFNGTIHFTRATDKIDDSGVLELNRLEGAYGEEGSRIWPFKAMRGKQPYDPVNKTLVINHVFGKDDTAFWTNFDYDKSIAAGMEGAGLPYSGEYDFIETVYYWPTTHMVAPKEDALDCKECHAENGRLASLTGFYMPGRDQYPWLDLIGWAAAGLTLAGSLLHGLLRLARAGRR